MSKLTDAKKILPDMTKRKRADAQQELQTKTLEEKVKEIEGKEALIAYADQCV